MKKVIFIVSTIVIIVLASLGLTGFLIKSTFEKDEKIKQVKKQEFNQSVEKVESSNNTFTCLKDIRDEDEYTVYIEQKVSYDDENKISEYYAKTLYEFDTEDAYNMLKDKLIDCEDKYEEETKVRCDINKNDMEKSIIGGYYVYYKEQLEGQGFVCE